MGTGRSLASGAPVSAPISRPVRKISRISGSRLMWPSRGLHRRKLFFANGVPAGVGLAIRTDNTLPQNPHNLPVIRLSRSRQPSTIIRAQLSIRRSAPKSCRTHGTRSDSRAPKGARISMNSGYFGSAATHPVWPEPGAPHPCWKGRSINPVAKHSISNQCRRAKPTLSRLCARFAFEVCASSSRKAFQIRPGETPTSARFAVR
jgi:hypothetical protein